ncbi:MAG: polyphosphate kinase 2 family protein [Bryobacterales bacterium]|nr:polyphosphate kinase 2 family protein [Bryobacterales bacterium]
MKPLLDKSILKSLRVPPGKKVNLRKDYPTALKVPAVDKNGARELLDEGTRRIAALQDKLYAQNTYAILMIFQALDAAGKDGTIKHVMSGINPQGCQVFSFKAPSQQELDHGYLWRNFLTLPERGRIGIFNRSYYEEVLVVRVHPEFLAAQQIPESRLGKGIWKQRFEEINNFEKYLVGNGTIVLKYFLHVSKDEQKKRFIERIDNPNKNWKFSVNDIRERAFFDDYLDAFEDCFRNTSTPWAPWHVIPADSKPLARVAVADILCRTLEGLKLRYPEVSQEKRVELLQARERLLEEEETHRAKTAGS